MNPANDASSLSVVVAMVALVAMIGGAVMLAARRGRPLELTFPRPPRKLEPVTESGGPGGSLEAELERVGRESDTLPAPPLESQPTGRACKACTLPATRAIPKASRGNRYEDAGGLISGRAVELDHHGDRLYGQPRPEVILLAAGDELCALHETVAFRLVERFHARQRARLNELTGELALQAASFEAGGLLRQLKKAGRANGED